MISKSQSVHPERLGIKEGTRVDEWIFLGESGNRIHFISRIGEGGNGKSGLVKMISR